MKSRCNVDAYQLKKIVGFEDGLKRIADILLGLILLAITIVTFPVVAILVWTTKGPLIFTQRRVGLNGKPFVMVKYRTMYGDVDDKKVSG
ncbi:MAG: sugar transferase [Patescibacteria group bacterium]